MAGGWARDGAVEQQIEDSMKDAVAAARSRLPAGDGEIWCVECGEECPERRRLALPGARTCVACQAALDRHVVHSAINRRGSKDSQLR
jgi:phage/conjugal plasmid C-4 type zinc finger TraR family protein